MARNLLGYTSPAKYRPRLKQPHAKAGLGKIGSRNQTIMATADNNHIILHQNPHPAGWPADSGNPSKFDALCQHPRQSGDKIDKPITTDRFFL